MKKWWKLAFLLFANFDNKEWVSWLQLMFYIKWWVIVAIKTSCFHMYNTFECHMKPNQKCQSEYDMGLFRTFCFCFYLGWLTVELSTDSEQGSLVNPHRTMSSTYAMFMHPYCPDRESNPGLPRDRRGLWHCTTCLAFWFLNLLWGIIQLCTLYLKAI